MLPTDHGYQIHSVTRGDDTFTKVKDHFDKNPDQKEKRKLMMEIFTSPTNQGQMFVAIVKANDGVPGEKLDYDCFNWEYRCIG